nr:FtsK/SpoIIIE domain-containing protein [Cellulosimicrobium arenosum]
MPTATPSALPARGTATLRVTVHPEIDVLLVPGTRLGDARAALARLTCRPELLTAALCVDGVVVDDEHRCGTYPLLPGATLTTARAGRRPHRDADRNDEGALADVLTSPWHVAVLTGPEAGRLVPVGTGPRCRARVDALDVHLASSRGRFRVRVPRGARRRRAGSRRRPRRIVAPWPVSWRAGVELSCGVTTYALRPRPPLGTGDGRDPRPDDRAPAQGRGLAAALPMVLVPAVASVALAVALGNPLYALLAVAGPLGLLVPALARSRRRRGSTGHDPGPPGPTDGVTSAALGGTAGDPLRPRPADVATRAVVAHLAPGGAHRRRPGGPRDDAGPSARRLLTSGDDGHDPHDPHDPHDDPSRGLPDGCVAVVGAPAGPRGRCDREPATALARAVVAELLLDGSVPVVRCTAAAEWSWCRWIPGARAVATLDDVERADVLVVDTRTCGPASGALGPSTVPAAELAAAWQRLGPGGTRLVLLATRATDVPAWCRTVVVATRTASSRTGTDGVHAAPVVGVGARWADTVARHLAAAHHRGTLGDAGPGALPVAGACDPAAPTLPDEVSLAVLLDAPSGSSGAADWLAARWSPAPDPRSLPVVLGTGADGLPVVLDLVADGPHVLVAGTTGAGKSELLQTLVTGLALTRSPTDLALALVDFKGGTSFGACGDLPHVAGRVTDLEPGLAGRALAGLRAELHRRERVLAAAGVSDLSDLPAGTMPRLVVVIDEFRALADDLPEFLPGLLRVAAQGRALGVHLVLATQRPAGAVSTDVRANISARLALRVVDPADSLDVVDSPLAARIPAGVPGRAILRIGAAPPVALQCARTSAPWRRRGAPVGAALAPPWGAAGRRAAPLDDPPEGPPDGTVDADDPAAVVRVAQEVARRTGSPTPAPPWLPALPERVGTADLPDAGSAAAGLPFGLADLPAEQRRDVARWDPADGHLAVVGRTRSGRTTTLHTLARAALDRGWHVHVVGGPALARVAQHPGMGTVVGRSDPRRVVRLLRLLAGHDDGQGRPAGLPHPGSPRPTLLVVDDVEALRTALDALPGAVGTDALADVLAAPGVHVAVAGSGARVAGLDAQVGVRVVLSSRDRHDDVSRGVPGALAGTGGPPGRAVLTGCGEPVVCQVAIADGPAPGRGAHPGGAPRVPTTDRPTRVAPVPDHVAVADLGAPDAAAPTTGHLLVPLGRGGDDGAVLALDLEDGALVAGPPGSGRSATLRLIVDRLADRGSLAGIAARDRRVPASAPDDVPRLTRYSPTDVGAFLDLLSARPAMPGTGVGPAVVVIDDLDQLAQLCLVEGDRLAALCRDGLRLVASSTTAAAATALRGPLAELRSARNGVVLGPAERGSSDVFGHPLERLADPGRTRAGRGVLVRGPRARPLQVALVDSFSPGAGRRESSPPRPAGA